MDLETKYTVIVGAGLTGLSAAWKLAESGKRCLLLERRSSPGGLADSLVLDNIIFDLGPHYIFPDPHSPGGRLMNDLLAEGEVISREFRYGIITDTHHYKMPIKGDIISYPFRYKLQILSNIFFGSKSKAPVRSLRHFIESKFGLAYYDEVFGDMVRKKTGRDGGELHLDWYIRPERDFCNNRQMLPPAASKMKRLLEPLKTFFSTNHYCYPQAGFGVLADRLLMRYQNFGGEALFNCGEVELVRSGKRITACRFKDKEVEVEELIWTGASGEINHLLPQENSADLHQIDTIIVLLTYNGKELSSCPYSYTYHPATDIIFNRAYLPGNILGEASPDNKSGICLEINSFSINGKTEEEMSEDDIIHHAVNDVDRLGFFKKSDLREFRFIRLKNSLPVYGLDYENQLTARNKSVQEYSNLYTVGRSGGAFFCMSTAAVNQGLKTAEHLLQSSTVKGT